MTTILETPRLALREMSLERRGLASEAALGVRAWAFETRGHDRVISLIRPENLPSQGVARKLGMTPEKRAQFYGMEHIVFAVRR
jgi:[ribosomal protein S5]-alanine N-acetyltransferase